MEERCLFSGSPANAQRRKTTYLEVHVQCGKTSWNTPLVQWTNGLSDTRGPKNRDVESC